MGFWFSYVVLLFVTFANNKRRHFWKTGEPAVAQCGVRKGFERGKKKTTNNDKKIK